MVKVEVIDGFTLGRFDELKNIKRIKVEEKGRLFVGDVFECSEEMYEYLTKNNAEKRAFVKLIEVKAEKKVKEENKEKKKTTKRGNSIDLKNK